MVLPFRRALRARPPAPAGVHGAGPSRASRGTEASSPCTRRNGEGLEGRGKRFERMVYDGLNEELKNGPGKVKQINPLMCLGLGTFGRSGPVETRYCQ